MKIDQDVMKNVERFLELAERYPDDVSKEYATSGDYYFSTKNQRKYIYVSAPQYMFCVHSMTGAIHDTYGRRPGYCLNIRDFLNWREWKFEKITFNRMTGIPIKTSLRCGVCPSTNMVGKTLQGLRCRSCRSSTTRHINIIRSLGFLLGAP